MSMAAPAPVAPPSSPPAPPPSNAPPATPPAPPPELTGSSRDTGAVRHETLRVLDWSVRGASKVLGDATVGFARLQGIITVGGKLTATDVRAEGTLNVLGPIEIGHRLALRGEGKFSKSLRTFELSSKGRLDLGGDLVATGPVELEGVTELQGGLTAGALTLRGSLLAPGEIALQGDLDATLEGRSVVGPIRAGRVTIRRPTFPPWRRSGELRTLRLEGTELRLEGVVAEFVKGTAIYVGAGCRLARVEGPIVERHRDSTVGPSAVTDDIPGGLWR